MQTKAEINQLVKGLSPVISEAVKKGSDTILTVHDVAEMLNISDRAVYQRCRRGQIPHRRKHGRLYFSKNTITKYYLEC